jgi:hypothetical protein
MTATAEDSRLAERFPEGEGWKTWGPLSGSYSATQ